MLSFHEPKLCPDCPLSTKWKNEALWRIKQRQYTKAKTEPSTLKICMERRKILEEQGVECPYFPKSEDITKFLGRVKKIKPLQLWHLHRFCDKHELDYQLIDNTLTYGENKEYLLSFVLTKTEDLYWMVDKHKESQESAWDQYLSEHFLTFYVTCMREGATKSEETGEPILTSKHFSLAKWIQQNSPFLG